ncbi:hypothetical protein DJ78_12195 [Halorubrum ezzemoulense]|uniref:Envelope protein N-terminal domain-containing protein n=2 Tax=Halorubrum ezzemoulense TaxID=337243 RepID=A0A256JKE1_HALEZ|nr:hypothetical protein DJ78_12195 [Halorubrum ezzemoulense]
MKSADERVMTSLRNNVTNAENVGLTKGKAAILEAYNNGATESEANTAMKEAVNGYFANIQQNLINHVNAQVNQIQSMIQSITSNENTETNSNNTIPIQARATANYIAIADSGSGIQSESTDDFTLVDGSTVQVEQFQTLKGSIDITVGGWEPKTQSGGAEWLRFKDASSQSDGEIDFGFQKYIDTMNEIISSRDNVTSDLNGFTTDVSNQYEPGEVPTEEFVDPVTAATELGTDTGLSSQAAAAGMMGIPTSAGFSLRLEITDGSGGMYQVDAEIYTNANPQDDAGNPTGFVVGETYDPDNFDAPIYASYEYVDTESGERTTDFTQLVEPFTVLEATDSDGNTVDNVSPEPNINQTSDVSKLEEELAQIREEKRRLQEEAQESTSGGVGAGFFGGGGPNTGVIAAVLGGGGVVYALFTQGDS